MKLQDPEQSCPVLLGSLSSSAPDQVSFSSHTHLCVLISSHFLEKTKLIHPGFGQAVITQLIEAGCQKLILGDASEEELAKVQARCKASYGTGVQVISKKCDAISSENLDEIIELGIREFGNIDYCANCERFEVPPGKTTEIALEEFTRASDTWQKGVSTTVITVSRLRWTFGCSNAKITWIDMVGDACGSTTFP